jgi:hypothetical protein
MVTFAKLSKLGGSNQGSDQRHEDVLDECINHCTEGGTYDDGYMTMAAARSTTLPFRMKFLNPLNMAPS